MKIVKSINELKSLRNEIKGSVGFVPTMGALHEGHMALIRRSAEKTDATIVSIFVNPTQFGPNEDFAKYPRTLDEDLKKCEETGAAIVFTPGKEEIYGAAKPLITFNVLPELSSILCGKSRPGHFNGVVQVVSILFNIVRPDEAFFGEKDFQQLTIIKKMVSDLHFPVKINGVPTVREKDGLAKSSRNRYLTPEERELAPGIFKVLESIKQKAEAARFDRLAVPIEFVQADAVKKLESFIPGVVIDYLEIRNSSDLSESRFLVKDSHAFIAVYIGKTRLIDNMFVGE